MRIDAGIEEHEIRLGGVEQARQMRLQNLQIGVVLHPIRQADIEIARDLANGIVLLRMHGEGEEIRLVAQAIGRAVALMHVEIDDERVADGAFPPQRLGGDGDIVEDAEAGTGLALSVMAAAGGAAGKPVLQRHARREQRARSRSPGTAHHARADRQADAALDLPRHRTGKHLIDVSPIMSQRDDVGGGFIRGNEAVRGKPFSATTSASRPYFRIGKRWPSGNSA